MRAVDSPAGPVDAGPTVLTLRHIFDDLFTAADARLEDHVTLIRQDVLARHFWPDGSRLDLFADEERSADAVAAFAGPLAEAQFRAFCARARRLFAAFEGPMLHTADPSVPALAARVLRSPRLIADMAPHTTLAASLARQFDDPRLAQLFGRYATYVGGAPGRVPALLALIWQAEATGVWVVEGGMHRLATAIARLAEERGARFRYRTEVARIDAGEGRATGVRFSDGTYLRARAVLFNGDPRALATGRLGPDVAHLAHVTLRRARSHSAQVWAFAARATGPDLAHHNIFFDADPRAEFDDLAAGRAPRTPSIYVCAEDRGQPAPPPGVERYEIILNAPPLDGRTAPAEDFAACHVRTFSTLARFGLRFDPLPGVAALATPRRFESLFPGSAGALYGQSPQGLTAALARPRARSGLRGLYLTGGGTHPGAGVPMAALSGKHAAQAILADRASMPLSRPAAMPGGMSTASATTGRAPSR